jgi:hypothetical protein
VASICGNSKESRSIETQRQLNHLRHERRERRHNLRRRHAQHRARRVPDHALNLGTKHLITAKQRTVHGSSDHDQIRIEFRREFDNLLVRPAFRDVRR